MSMNVESTVKKVSTVLLVNFIFKRETESDYFLVFQRVLPKEISQNRQRV